MTPESPEVTARRAHLSQCDEPCPGCGYNLRGVTGAVCPECGDFLRWPLREAGGKVHWWVGLAGMTCTYMFLVALAASVLWGDWVLSVIAVLFLVDGPRLLRRWLRNRRAFARLPRHQQQQLAAAWWLAAIFCGLLTFVLLRINLGPHM
jgi:hypothetical protein